MTFTKAEKVYSRLRLWIALTQTFAAFSAHHILVLPGFLRSGLKFPWLST